MPHRNTRSFARRRINTAIGIDTMERKERAGITRNVSAGGVLFHSASRFALGQHLELRFRAPLTAPTHMRSEIQLTGTVVRVATDARDTAFRHLTAVKFDEPTPTLTA